MASTKKSSDSPVCVKKASTPREQLLEQAIRLTAVDRNKSYGNPEDNFKNIATLWSNYLTASTGIEITISPSDVAYMMIHMKLARLSTNPTHYDSVLDVAGYAACAADCIAAEQNKNRSNIGEANSVGQAIR